MQAAVIFAWALAAALTLWWLWQARPVLLDPAPAEPADPHAAEVAAFRRLVHDWDRRGTAP